MFDEIQFYLFDHYPYIDAPPNEQRYESTWVNDPNQRYTRELLLAEDLGFDAIALNEHHQAAKTTAHVEDAPGVHEKERSR